MSGFPFMANQEWLPTVTLLEDSFEILERQAKATLELAREELRHVQDIEAELDALDDSNADSYGIRQAARHTAAHRLRWIARRFSIAQAQLVPPEDERFTAAEHVLSMLAEAERRDAPWRAEESASAA